MQRDALLQRLRESRRWDLVIIGGGATGLGAALDATTRGLSTLLLEARDFATLQLGPTAVASKSRRCQRQSQLLGAASCTRLTSSPSALSRRAACGC